MNLSEFSDHMNMGERIPHTHFMGGQVVHQLALVVRKIEVSNLAGD
jgi:hypothetical protein